MEQSVKILFNNNVAKQGAALFGFDFDRMTFLGAWQNFIYEYAAWNEKSYILRFTPSSHRDDNSIQAELEWIIYLSNHEVAVSTPILSKQGQLTELIQIENLYFTVTAFVKAEGRKIGYPECLRHISMYQTLGQTMGRMHALSTTYKPLNKTIKRHNWYHNYYLQHLHVFVPSEQAGIHHAANRLITTIKTNLPKDPSSYGLIHGDLGIGNYLYNDHTGGITLFDFDEAQYSWYIEDIAVPLYYLVYVYGGEEGKKDRESQALLFMEHFMKGYNQERSVEDYWFKQLPLLLQLREIIVYSGMYRSADLLNLDAWSRDYLSESKTRIENGIPIVDVWS